MVTGAAIILNLADGFGGISTVSSPNLGPCHYEAMFLRFESLFLLLGCSWCRAPSWELVAPEL